MTNNTMNNQSSIEKVVMRRILYIRILRPFVSNGAIATLILGLALWGIGKEVWVARVFQNAPHNVWALPQFYLAAFDHTRFLVQVLTLATLVSLFYLARETAKLLSFAFVGPQRI
jgi:hypothetical protein